MPSLRRRNLLQLDPPSAAATPTRRPRIWAEARRRGWLSFSLEAEEELAIQSLQVVAQRAFQARAIVTDTGVEYKAWGESFGAKHLIFLKEEKTRRVIASPPGLTCLDRGWSCISSFRWKQDMNIYSWQVEFMSFITCDHGCVELWSSGN